MSMRRRQLVRMFVLDAIADDFENLEEICKSVTNLGSACGLVVECSEVLQSLVDLIESGLAKAYRLSPVEPVVRIDGVPARDVMCYLYFFVTDEGAALQRARYGDWPFDDDGSLMKDWSPPSS